MQNRTHAALFVLSPPYQSAEVLASNRSLGLSHQPIPAGSILIWNMGGEGNSTSTLHVVARRPFGVPLVIYLPQADTWKRKVRESFRIIEEARPARILPYQPSLGLADIVQLVREGPGALPAELLDYLSWRGFWIDQETRQMLYRIGELSEEITTLGSVARSLYTSRRSMGRRFQIRGLPAPSHWLKLFRILRAAILMQRTGLSLQDVARNLHYPDAFTLSNQMYRLIGVRPEVVRDRVGWEWILESWIVREEALGNFGFQTSEAEEVTV
jgi:AraC-like DNA-binding protein